MKRRLALRGPSNGVRCSWLGLLLTTHPANGGCHIGRPRPHRTSCGSRRPRRRIAPAGLRRVEHCAGLVKDATFTSVKDLISSIETFIDGWNERCEPFVWPKPADDSSTNNLRSHDFNSATLEVWIERRHCDQRGAEGVPRVELAIDCRPERRLTLRLNLPHLPSLDRKREGPSKGERLSSRRT
jgi:hypothetical protein